MIGFLATALGAALLGSVHCAAMCGPLATLYRDPGRGGACAGDHAAFAGARLVGYVILGVLAGLIGHTINLGASAVASWQAAAAVLTGVMLIAMGLVALLGRLGVRVPFAAHSSKGSAPKLVKLVRGKPRHRAILVGALTASLPCGWLLAFVLAAAGTGSPVWGGATMAMLWLGSAPILAFVAVGLGQLAKRLGAHARYVAPVLLIAAGISVLTMRASVPTVAAAAATSASAHASPQLGEPSCHGD